jgi:hypothetical protein
LATPQPPRTSRPASAGAASDPGGAVGASDEDSRLSEIEALLLDLYERINDPDGVYAIAAILGSASGRLRLQQCEGRWPEVLAAADERLQHPAAAPAGPGLGGTAVDLLRALTRMGCRHTAQRYLQSSLANTGGSSGACAADSATREAQAELAWRLGEWDTAGQGTAGALAAPAAQAAVAGTRGEGAAVGNGGGAGGFHAGIFRSLQLLRAGDGEAFGAALAEARHAAVGALATSGDESAVTVNHALVGGRVFQPDSSLAAGLMAGPGRLAGCWCCLGLTSCVTQVQSQRPAA